MSMNLEAIHNRLEQLKRQVEHELGRSLVWGDFLLILAGLQGEVGQDMVAHLREGESTAQGAPEEATTESWPGLPIVLSPEDQERIAELVAAKVYRRLRRVYFCERRKPKRKQK